MAATFTVNSTVDSVDAAPGNGICADTLNRCTLRAAIRETNALAGADTIIIPAGTYTLTITPSGDNAALRGDLDVTGSLTITGAGAATTIIQAGATTATGIDRVFHINPLASATLTVNISGVTIRNGRINGAGAGILFDGADFVSPGCSSGCFNGVLNITNSTISGNQASADGGGIQSRDGTLNVTNSTISGNVTLDGDGAGIFHGTSKPNATAMLITGSTISGNQANGTTPDPNGGLFFGKGGGVRVSGLGRYLIQNSTISNNQADDDGGGLHLFGASLVDNNTQIIGNTSGGRGGGVYSDLEPTIIGAAASPEGETVFDGVTIKGNTATLDGGGVFHDRDLLTIKNSTIGGSSPADKNMAANGGGLATYLDSGVAGQTGTLVVDNTTIGANVATGNGGGLLNGGHTVQVINNSAIGGATPGQGNTAGSGGGVFASGGTLNITGITIRGNSSIVDGGGGLASTGGTINLDACSISGNTAASNGGGIFNNGGTITLINDSAIGNPGNTAAGNGGGIASNGGTLTMTSGAIMGNTATGDGGGVFTSGGAVNLVPSTATVISIINNSAVNSGGAIATTGGTTTVAKSNFSGNSATSDGGGAIIHNGGSLFVNLSRIVGNSASDASSTGLKHTAGSLDATNNWWGCNIDPTIPGNGCDTVSGTTAHNPRLVLNHTASPNQIPVNGTSTLTAHFLTNSAGGSISGSDLIVLGGLPVTFHNAVLGTISNADPLISNGQATATYTAGPVGGNGSADATVDNGTATAHITIEEAPTISCPADVTVNAAAGQNTAVVTYPAPTATGFPVPTVNCSPASGSTFNAGQTTVTCTATNGVNPDASCSFIVTVITNQPPVANAGNDQTIECAGATTPVTLDGSGSSDPDGDTPLTYDWAEGANPLGSGAMLNVNLSSGSHTITLTVTDPSGAFDTDTVVINIVDTQAPVITVNGANPMTVECHTSFTDPGATANDGCAGSVPVTSSGTVDPDTPGTYTITYTATDGTHTATATRTVNVVDTIDPVITINGANPMTVECHTTFTDPGATANDGCAGNVPVTSSSNVNPNVVGTYTVTYTASDGSNTATATRTVIVVDTIAPTITLNGANPMTVECHTPFVDPGATANDGCAGNLTASIVVSTNANPNVPGQYTITYTVSDGSNTTTATRTVNVVDNTAPTITLINNLNITLWPPNHQYETLSVANFVASASDGCDSSIDLSDVYITKVTSDETENGNGDGNTLNDIVIAANCKSVNLRSERQGSGNGRVYTITFKVKDAAGNFTTATAKVKVPKSQGNNGGAVEDAPQYTVTSNCP